MVNYLNDFSLIEDIFYKLTPKEQDFVSHECKFVPLEDILWYKIVEGAFIEVTNDYLFDVAVLKEKRHLGIATSLINEAFSKFGTLKTWCSKKNKASYNLLTKLGFKIVDEDIDEWVLMQKL